MNTVIHSLRIMLRRSSRQLFVALGMVLLACCTAVSAETPRAFLAGKSARLLCVLPLSDGTILAGGAAADLGWLPSGTRLIELPAQAANGWSLPASEGEDAARRGFLLHLSSDLGTVLSAVALPSGLGGGNITSLKTDAVPGSKTGAIYLAGTNGQKYWLAKLDANFLDTNPAKLAWGYDKETGRVSKLPLDAMWDVGGDGKIVFYNYGKKEWGVVCRLKADGSGLDSVPQWRESFGATQPDGSEAKVLSLKTGNGSLRSKTWEEFLALTPDGNGGLRRGTWPDDLYHAGPLDGGVSGRGYTGYVSRNTAATSAAIAVDRRNNAIYVGYNVQSILPPWNDIPNAGDFEPTVVAFSSEGTMRWWSRLYTEISTNAGPFISKDAGKTWAKLGEGFVFGDPRRVLQTKNATLLVGPTGVQMLKPGGSWETAQGAPQLHCIAQVGDALLAGGNKGAVLRSNDHGKTWTPLPSGLPASKKPVIAIAAHSTKPDQVFAAVEETGLFVSRDGASTWTQLGSPKRNVVDVVLHPRDANVIFVLSSDGLEKSADDGATWSRLDVPGGNFTALSIDPDQPETMFVSSNSKEKEPEGIRFTTDGGQTWTTEKVGNRKIATVLCMAGSDAVFCGSYDRGLFKRGSDGKNDWTRMDQAPGLIDTKQSIRLLVQDPSHPDTVMAFSGGAGNLSTPDQYVDGLAVDYSQPAERGDLVVLARAHGNNVTNLWHGLEGKSFVRRQTGTKGNAHYQWIGRFKSPDGTFINATWFVGLDPFSTGFGKPYEDPNLDGWPDHNGGNANLSAAQGRGLRVGADGSVLAVGTSRGAISTARAFQKMTNPLLGKAPWHDFVRLHAPDLSTVTYATALTGEGWDTAAGEGAGNTHIAAAAALPDGRLLVVGSHNGTGTTIPTANVPAWGRTTPDGECLMLGLFDTK